MPNWRYPCNDPEMGPAYDADASDHYGRKCFDQDGNRIYRRKDGKEYSGPEWRRVKREERKFQ